MDLKRAKEYGVDVFNAMEKIMRSLGYKTKDGKSVLKAHKENLTEGGWKGFNCLNGLSVEEMEYILYMRDEKPNSKEEPQIISRVAEVLIIPRWIKSKINNLDTTDETKDLTYLDLEDLLNNALDTKDYEWAKDIAERMENL